MARSGGACAYEHDLLTYATAGLLTVPGLHLIGTARAKASVLSFVLDGFPTEDVGKALNEEGIAVRAGHLHRCLPLPEPGGRGRSRSGADARHLHTGTRRSGHSSGACFRARSGAAPSMTACCAWLAFYSRGTAVRAEGIATAMHKERRGMQPGKMLRTKLCGFARRMQLVALIPCHTCFESSSNTNR